MDVDNSIKEMLAKNYHCYVLLTCNGPKENGEMDVQMSYEGPPLIASYMLHTAQSIVDNDAVESQDINNNDLCIESC